MRDGAVGMPVSPVLVAIILGLAVRNTFDALPAFDSGIEFARDRVLKTGLVVLGLQISLGSIGRIGADALPVVLICIVAALTIVALIARLTGVSARLGALIAVGTSICGCTAVVAAAPVVRARESEVCYAVACVALFGSVAMIAYPFVAHELFGGHPAAAGVFLGTAIHDTSPGRRRRNVVRAVLRQSGRSRVSDGHQARP